VTGLVEAMMTLGYGLASALIPVVNAEAYAVLAGHRTGHAVVVVVVLAFGQTAGKLLLFEAARRGTGRLNQKLARRNRLGRAQAVAARWAEPLRRWLSSRRTGLPTVFVSPPPAYPVGFRPRTRGQPPRYRATPRSSAGKITRRVTRTLARFRRTRQHPAPSAV